ASFGRHADLHSSPPLVAAGRDIFPHWLAGSWLPEVSRYNRAMSTAPPNLAPPQMTSSQDTPWEFWIDVGGTFTDCFGRRPDGTLIRHKLLSSGATKGAAAEGSTAQAVIDPARRRDPQDFWTGYTFQLLDA